MKELIKSKEKYGGEAVLVSFQYGKGAVCHMIFHFYLQHSETKDAKQAGNASAYMSSKNIMLDDAELMEKAENLNYGNRQSHSIKT